METTKQNSPLISAADLVKLLATGNSIVLVDARSGADAKQQYAEGHLESAQHVDLEKDLSQPVNDAARGGRHPLPEIKVFTALLGLLGIDAASHVIVYDDKAGANAAARFWWMLKSLGHQNIQVLDGGLAAAVKQGVKTTNLIIDPIEKPAYPALNWKLPIADADKVEMAAKDQAWMVIDVREAYRYNGESEPIDTIAGHIPGAVNMPYAGNLNPDGSFLSANELADKYKAAIGERDPHQLIVHCGSGVTACHTLLALEQAGIQGAQLYVGSWSEWSRSKKPVAVGG